MIDPKLFLSQNTKKEEDLIDFEGSYGCPEQGCYEITQSAKFNERERVVTWICSNGHLGRATL